PKGSLSKCRGKPEIGAIGAKVPQKNGETQAGWGNRWCMSVIYLKGSGIADISGGRFFRAGWDEPPTCIAPGCEIRGPTAQESSRCLAGATPGECPGAR